MSRSAPFLLPTTREFAGRKFRELSAGSVELCRMLGVTFVDKLGLLAEMDEAEGRRQVLTFLFIHGFEPAGETEAEKVDELLRVLALPAAELAPHLVRFSLGLPMAGVMPFLVEWIHEANQRTGESMFRVLKKIQDAVKVGDGAASPNA